MEKFKLEPVSGGYVTVPKTNEHPLLCLLHNGEPFGEVGSLCHFDSIETFVPHLRSVAQQYGLTIKVVWRRGPKATLAILHEEPTIPKKAIDLSAQLEARGIPLSAWVMPDGSILTGLPSRQRVLGNTVKRRGRPTSQQIASALNVLTVLFGDLKRTYFNLEDFLSKQGVDTPYDWGRCLYKATACGPWVSFTAPVDQRGDVYYEDPLARQSKGEQTWWSSCTGLTIGSIVEGSDVEVRPVSLSFPFNEDQLDKGIEDIDTEADFYWQRDNSTYYTVRNASGNVHLKCVWTSFEDDPTGSWAEDDIEAFELAKLAGNTLFEVGSRSYEDLIPIPGTDWFVQEDPTPDTIYRPEPSR